MPTTIELNTIYEVKFHKRFQRKYDRGQKTDERRVKKLRSRVLGS